MKQTMNRMFALFLCAVMLLGMFPAVTVSAASGEYIYFDNSEMQWDTVYAQFVDTDWNELDIVKMTNTGSNIWRAEISEGSMHVAFGPKDDAFGNYWTPESGRTYTRYTYKHDKVYLYISAAYVEENYPGMDSFTARFCTTDLVWHNVAMSPVEGKADLWYADVPENAIRDNLYFYGSGNGQYWSGGWPGEDQYNMYFATVYGKDGWGIYDANATYEDELKLSGEYVSFDNSEMKWDTVYAYFMDSDWNDIGSGFKMTKSSGNIWNVEIPVGAYIVQFGTKESCAYGRNYWISEIGETPTMHTYKHGKIYLYASEAYRKENNTGMDSFTANFRTTDLKRHEVEMSPVKGKADLWYADVPENAIMETLEIMGKGDNGYWGTGYPWDEQYNMYFLTLYGKNDWGTYDASAKYEDKQDLSGEFIYFDNSEVQWETVYVRYWDSNWNELGAPIKMTEGKNDKWSIETPKGVERVAFGPEPYNNTRDYQYEAGKTYTESYYKYSKVYYYRSALYEEMHGQDYSNVKVQYQSAKNGYQTVEMKPVKGKDNIWYASITEDDVYLGSIGICHGSMQWGWGISPEKGTNMLLATLYGGIYWDKYDADKAYKDEPAGKCGEKAKWKFDAATGTLTISGSGAMKDYWGGETPWWTLSDQIKTINIEKGITAIGDYAFYNLYNAKKVSIGSTVKSIGRYAFTYCGLTSVRLPAALKTLEDYAFCDTPLKTVTISSSNKYFCVSNNVLFNKSKTILYLAGTGHTSYTVPKTVDVIKPYAFSDPSLTKLTISEGVQEIGDCAFINTSVKTVKLPASLKKMGIVVFGTKLTSYTVASGSKYFSTKDGILFNKAKTKLVSCPAGYSGSYTVPSTVKALADYAFWCAKVTKVKLPTSVTKIPEGAFANCIKLASINLHSKITSIGNFAFENNRALTKITIPASVTSWGGYSFAYSGLKEVTFKYGAKTLGSNTFYGCTNLAKVYLPETINFSAVATNYESPFRECGTATTKGKTYLITHENAVAENLAKRNGMLFKEADHKDDNGKCAYCNKSMKLEAPKVTAENVSSTGKIKLSWKESIVAEKYQVYRATSKSGEYERIATTEKTSYTDKTAKAGKKYYYKVRALDEDDKKSSFSSVVSCLCVLAQPEVSITTKSGDPRLTWEKVDGAAKYYIYRATSKNGEYKKIKGTTATSFTDTTAKAGTKYYYKVKAVHSNTDANSVYSAVKYITAK